MSKDIFIFNAVLPWSVRCRLCIFTINSFSVNQKQDMVVMELPAERLAIAIHDLPTFVTDES